MLCEVGNMKPILEMQLSYLSAGGTVAMLHVKKFLLVESQAIDEAGISHGGCFPASIHLCFVITFLVFC